MLWISTDKETPDDDRSVLVDDLTNNQLDIAYYSVEERKWFTVYHRRREEIVVQFWMPMPPKPREMGRHAKFDIARFVAKHLLRCGAMEWVTVALTEPKKEEWLKAVDELASKIYESLEELDDVILVNAGS